MNFLHTFFLYVFYVRLTPYICTYNLDILSLLEFSAYNFLVCFLRTFSLVCFSHSIHSTCIFYIQFLGMFSTYVQPSMFFMQYQVYMHLGMFSTYVQPSMFFTQYSVYIHFLHTVSWYVFYIRSAQYICKQNRDILSLHTFSTY